MNAHKFPAGTVEKKGAVLKITIQKDEVITVDDMKAITKIRQELFGNKNYVALIDMRDEDIDMTDEAVKYVTSADVIQSLRIAEVLLVKSFTQKIEVHSYVKIMRSDDNITVMTDEENAIHWLNRQYDKHQGTNLEKAH